MAALNKWAIVQASSNIQTGLSTWAIVIQAAQLGMVWRSARKIIFVKEGGNEDEFVDVDPWDARRALVASAKLAASAAKANVSKMVSFVVQTDECELLPPDKSLIQAWLQRYVLHMGGPNLQGCATVWWC